MPTLHCYVDQRTLTALEIYARQNGRTVEDLAEAAISEAALVTEAPKAQPKPKAPRP